MSCGPYCGLNPIWGGVYIWVEVSFYICSCLLLLLVNLAHILSYNFIFDKVVKQSLVYQMVMSVQFGSLVLKRKTDGKIGLPA